MLCSLFSLFCVAQQIIVLPLAFLPLPPTLLLALILFLSLFLLDTLRAWCEEGGGCETFSHFHLPSL